jgi:aminoethylphosphonate catabolism LysR family transcriptional regulator
MNLAQLRAFYAVAREGGFTAAARVFNLTQATLSGQVKALEENYGVRLFERRWRRVETTPLGDELLDFARRIFDLEDQARDMLTYARDLGHGWLRVGADGPYHVIPALAAFNQRYPGLNVSLKVGNSEEVLRDLLDYSCDVAVLANLQDDPRLFALPFRRDSLMVFVAKDHPLARHASISLKELDGQPMVMREVGSATRRIFEDALHRSGVEAGAVMEMDGREAVREAVAAGLGLGVVSEAEYVADDRLKALGLGGAKLLMTEYVVCLAERRKLRIVSAFFELAGKLAQIRQGPA